MSLLLREITRDTVRTVCALEVRDDQKDYVATNALSMAQAHFEPSAVFRAVCLDGQPVGFVQWKDAEAPGTATLWRFMIDRRHQSIGLGRRALALVFNEMRERGFRSVETSVVRGPSSPLGFYLSRGFVELGRETAGGEWLLSSRL